MCWFLLSTTKTTDKYPCVPSSIGGWIQHSKRAMLALAYLGLFLQRCKWICWEGNVPLTPFWSPVQIPAISILYHFLFFLARPEYLGAMIQDSILENIRRSAVYWSDLMYKMQFPWWFHLIAVTFMCCDWMFSVKNLLMSLVMSIRSCLSLTGMPFLNAIISHDGWLALLGLASWSGWLALAAA